MADGSIAVCRSRRDVCGHCPGRAKVAHPCQGLALGVDDADDLVVAATALELVLADGQAWQRARACESGSIEHICEVAAHSPFNVDQRVGADPGTGDRAGRQVDGDGAGSIAVDRAVETIAAVEPVIAAKTPVAEPLSPAPDKSQSVPVATQVKPCDNPVISTANGPCEPRRPLLKPRPRPRRPDLAGL